MYRASPMSPRPDLFIAVTRPFHYYFHPRFFLAHLAQLQLFAQTQLFNKFYVACGRYFDGDVDGDIGGDDEVDSGDVDVAKFYKYAVEDDDADYVILLENTVVKLMLMIVLILSLCKIVRMIMIRMKMVMPDLNTN
ncbi:unnamed protein product [Protopolystoma xenopodis]|uniref:Uncharacterized protein n=1 Tax=Protopolystoma xenopodis TaxID=117903 RepID=A0A448WX76_9PLAT|nr:unnamed protein product [Protopolystoma xenopodis]